MIGRRMALALVCGTPLAASSAVLAQVGGMGPDVIVGDLTGPTKWGTIGNVTSYSIGTTSCNVGTAELNWIELSNQHPVIAQNVYRLKDGRLEQIGMSWLKHGFCALQQSICGSCHPAGPQCEDALGVGCSDPYTANRNGGQARLGPRSEVNAFTGAYPWPHGQRGVTGDALYKRIQINNDDLNPDLNSGALYFGEGQYVSLDDSQAGNGRNNASYKRLNVGGLSGGGHVMFFAGATERTKPAIYAWRDHGLGADTPDPDVHLVELDVEGEGRFILGYKATELGGGMWRYEYALQNLNSDRSAGIFAVTKSRDATPANVGFHDVHSHSGEPYDTADWSLVTRENEVVWSCTPHEVNENANALRWGTLYNFRFDSNLAPRMGSVAIGLFKPGSPEYIFAQAFVPIYPPCICDYVPDGVNSQDFFDFLVDFFQSNPRADVNNSGIVDSQDYFDFLTCFFDPPPYCY